MNKYIEPGTFRELSPEEIEESRHERESQARLAEETETGPHVTIIETDLQRYHTFVDSEEYQNKKRAKGRSLDVVYYGCGEDYTPAEGFYDDEMWLVDTDERAINDLIAVGLGPNRHPIHQSAFDFHLPEERKPDVVIMKNASMDRSGEDKVLPLVKDLDEGGFVFVSHWGSHDDARVLANQENFKLIGRFTTREIEREGKKFTQQQIDKSNTDLIKKELQENAQMDFHGHTVDKYGGGTTFIFQKLHQ